MIESNDSLSRLKQRYLDAVLIGEATSAGIVVEEGLKQGFGMFDIYLSILIPTQIDLGRHGTMARSTWLKNTWPLR